MGCPGGGARGGTGAAGGSWAGDTLGEGQARPPTDEAGEISVDVDVRSIAGWDDTDEGPVAGGPVLAVGQREEFDSEQNLLNQETCHRVEILLQ